MLVKQCNSDFLHLVVLQAIFAGFLLLRSASLAHHRVVLGSDFELLLHLGLLWVVDWFGLALGGEKVPLGLLARTCCRV